MSFPGEPKTIEDYKDVVKILKLKIIKQNKRIQQLQSRIKNYEQQANSLTLRGDELQINSRIMADYDKETQGKKEEREKNMNTLAGKVQVMQLLAKGIAKIGLSPEAVFRVADVNYKHFVQADHFREVLNKMRLGLSQKELSCLIFIFDQNCSGFITRQDYCNTLYAYKIGAENDFHYYLQECIFKLSQMLHSDKIDLAKFYAEMEGKSNSKSVTGKKQIQINAFEEQIKKYYQGRIMEREIVGAFQAIDLQSQGFLQKNNFLYCVTSYINKLLTGEDLSRKSQQEFNPNQRSQYTENNMESRGSPKKDIESFNELSKAMVNHMGSFMNPSKPVNPYTPKEQWPKALANYAGGFMNAPNPVKEGVLGRLQSEFGVNLYRIYQELILFDFGHRLTLNTFKKRILSHFNTIPSQLIGDLYKEIDDKFQGSLYFKDLLHYYLINSNDNEMILLGKYFALHDLTAEKYWFQYGLNPETDLSKDKFLECMSSSFETKDPKLWQNLWTLFDKSKGTCSVEIIIKTFSRYEIHVQS